VYTERYAAGVADMPKIDGGSTATWWNRIRDGEIAYFRVILDWIGTPPPREGRVPSYKEYVAERLAAPSAKRNTPRGVHRGRPRKVIG
jgi:hypothetical protein